MTCWKHSTVICVKMEGKIMREYIDKKTVLAILSNGGYPEQQLEEIEGLPVVETDQKPVKKTAKRKKKRLENAVPVTFVSPEAPASGITVILQMDPAQYMAYLQINNPDVRCVFLMDILFHRAVGVIHTERGYRRYKERDFKYTVFDFLRDNLDLFYTPETAECGIAEPAILTLNADQKIISKLVPVTVTVPVEQFSALLLPGEDGAAKLYDNRTMDKVDIGSRLRITAHTPDHSTRYHINLSEQL